MLRPPYLSVQLCVIFVPARKTQNTAREYCINDQPDRRKRNENIGYDRPDAAVSHKDRRNEIEVEYPVQPPIHRSEQNEDVRYDVRNDH